MSYNITSINIKKIENVTVNLAELIKEGMEEDHFKIKIVKQSKDSPENSVMIELNGQDFFAQLLDGVLRVTKIHTPEWNANISITDRVVSWAKKSKGSLEMIVTWEGGDSIIHTIIENGEVIKDEDILE